MDNVEGTKFVNTDQPLKPGSAATSDKLGRIGFAERVVDVLRKVSSSSGLTVSIEGEWGSGKTSILAMVEELLEQKPSDIKPVIVHFNPWLIGDRDALVRQFLAKIRSAIKLADHSENAKKVARELKSYAKAFDVIRLIPGAEPWASIVKSVISSVGGATDSIADHKAPDLDQQKAKVEEALRRYPRQIVVIIDDIDRLFPSEVYEMVRIIKSVGDFPNVGYVVAWDSKYVVEALSSAQVPQSNSYLDKIVQIRLPLPRLSLSGQQRLIDEALASFPPEALKDHFPGNDNRLAILYQSGLKDILEYPRDIARVFNTTAILEPVLRGEIIFSDIVGLAALMVKAPDVYNILRQNPQWFVGSLPGDLSLKESDKLIGDGSAARESACSNSSRPEAVKGIMGFLFPLVAKDEETLSLGGTSEIDGYLASPPRLLVALQASVTPFEVSLVNARTYLVHPEKRKEIERSLSIGSCLEFLQRLGDVAESMGGVGISDLDQLCLAISRMIDMSPFPEKSYRREIFGLPVENVAARSMKMIVMSVNPDREQEIADLIIKDENSLTSATDLLDINYLPQTSSNPDLHLIVDQQGKDQQLAAFAENVKAAAVAGKLLLGCNSGYVLNRASRLVPSICPEVLHALESDDPTLDQFAMKLFDRGQDSSKGQIYSLPKDPAIVEAYCSLDQMKEHARSRIDDPSLTYPTRAVWEAVIDGKPRYAVDGSEYH